MQIVSCEHNLHEISYPILWFSEKILKNMFVVCRIFLICSKLSFLSAYFIYSKYLDRQAWANSVDLDKTLP